VHCCHDFTGLTEGLTENAEGENDGPSKLQGVKKEHEFDISDTRSVSRLDITFQTTTMGTDRDRSTNF